MRHISGEDRDGCGEHVGKNWDARAKSVNSFTSFSGIRYTKIIKESAGFLIDIVAHLVLVINGLPARRADVLPLKMRMMSTLILTVSCARGQ